MDPTPGLSTKQRPITMSTARRSEYLTGFLSRMGYLINELEQIRTWNKNVDRPEDMLGPTSFDRLVYLRREQMFAEMVRLKEEYEEMRREDQKNTDAHVACVKSLEESYTVPANIINGKVALCPSPAGEGWVMEVAGPNSVKWTHK